MSGDGMTHWGFASGEGNQITRGWQGYQHQACALALKFAATHGTVSFWNEGDPDEEYTVTTGES